MYVREKIKPNGSAEASTLIDLVMKLKKDLFSYDVRLVLVKLSLMKKKFKKMLYGIVCMGSSLMKERDTLSMVKTAVIDDKTTNKRLYVPMQTDPLQEMIYEAVGLNLTNKPKVIFESLK